MLTALIDTETTGLPNDPDARAVEVAVSVFDEDCPELFDTLSNAEPEDLLEAFVQRSRSWSSLVCPRVLTEEGLALSLEISGITEDEIRAAPTPEQLLVDLEGVLDGFTIPVRAWNTEFDFELFNRTFCADLDRESPLTWNGCAMIDFSARWVDMVGLHPDTMEPRWISVKRAARLAGIPYSEEQAHRACFDTQLSGCLDYCSRNGIIAPPEQTVPTPIVRVGQNRHRNPASVKTRPIVVGKRKSERPDPGQITIGPITIGRRR